MNRFVFTLGAILIFTSVLFAQQTTDYMDLDKHQIVMQFSEADSISQFSLMEQVRNIRKEWPNAEIEVVCQGPGIYMLVQAKTKVARQIDEWQRKGVVFAACNNSMQKRNVVKEDLVKVAEVVPAALVEIVKKQEQGWAYLH